MSRLNELLTVRLKSLFVKFKPNLSILEHASAHAHFHNTILYFNEFTTKLTFYELMSHQIVKLIDAAFNDENLDDLMRLYPDRFSELRAKMHAAVTDFYLSKVLGFAFNFYKITDLNDQQSQLFDANFRLSISYRKLPVAELSLTFAGFNEVYIFNALNLIAAQIVSGVFEMSCSKHSLEISNINDAVFLNAIWIVDKLETNLNKDIDNINFEGLNKLKNSLLGVDCKTFSSVYDYSTLNNVDMNELLLILAVTHTENLTAVPLCKRDILGVLNVPLLLHSVLYLSLSLSLEEYNSISKKDFLERFSNSCILLEQYLPFPHDQLGERKDKIAITALNYMIQFVLRITDYKVVFEMDDEFHAKCMADCNNLRMAPLH